MQSESADAARTLAEVDRVRRHTRQALNPIWFSNLVVGVFFAGTALVAAAEASVAVALAYWIGGGLLALGLIVHRYASMERELGVETRGGDASTAIVLAMIAGIVVLNSVADAGLFAGAAGMVALGYVLRDRIEAAAGVALAVVAAAVLLLDPTEPGIWGNLGLGLVLVAAGLAGRAARA